MKTSPEKVIAPDGSENMCPHIAPHDPHADEWHNRRVLIRRELRRHKLSDNALRITEIILEMSLGQGLESVLIPDHDCFSGLTGIRRSHVSETLLALREMRIVRLTSRDGFPIYSIREDPDSEGLSPFDWRVQPRTTLREMERAVGMIREHNGLPPLPESRALEASENFKSGPLAQKIAPANPEGGFPSVLRNGEQAETPQTLRLL